MQAFENVAQIERMFTYCPLYRHTIWAPVIGTVVFFPMFVTFYTIGNSLMSDQDIYLTCVSAAMVFNFVLNYILQVTINSSPRFPECYGQYGAPSWALQYLVFLDVVVCTYAAIYNRPMRWKIVIVSRLLVTVTMFCWVYIGANTITEMLIGALVGALYGLFFHWIVFTFIRPSARWIISIWPLPVIGVANAYL